MGHHFLDIQYVHTVSHERCCVQSIEKKQTGSLVTRNLGDLGKFHIIPGKYLSAADSSIFGSGIFDIGGSILDLAIYNVYF